MIKMMKMMKMKRRKKEEKNRISGSFSNRCTYTGRLLYMIKTKKTKQKGRKKKNDTYARNSFRRL